MPNRLLIDANLLVLLVVGLANETYIEKHKRLAAFDRTDYLLLKELIGASSGIIVTPHVLAEASNLLRQVKDPLQRELTARLRRLIEDVTETQVGARIAVARNEFLWLGLTDAAILATELEDVTILTADAGLHISAEKAGRKSLNYNHIRDQRPDFRI